MNDSGEGLQSYGGVAGLVIQSLREDRYDAGLQDSCLCCR